MTAPVVLIARNIAIQAHAGAINKHDGEIYLLHVSRVAANARAAAERRGLDPDIAEAIAWLHDVVEDTPWTIEDIRKELWGPGNTPIIEGVVIEQICTSVFLLTKVKGVDSTTYYLAIKTDVYATCVKLDADIVDNFRRNHLIKDEATRARMGGKYSQGVDILS